MAFKFFQTTVKGDDYKNGSTKKGCIMSTEQENFDDLLKSKLDENEFAFNEANWDKAEMLIIQAEKKRKRRIIGFIFFIGLILGICVMIPFIGAENDTNIKKTDLNDKKSTQIENKTESEIRPKNISEKDNKVTKTGENEKAISVNEQIASSENKVLNENTSEEVNQKKDKAVITGSYPNEKQRNNSLGTVFTKTKNNKVTKDKEQKGRSEDYKKNHSQLSVKENQKTEIAIVNNSKKEVETNKEMGNQIAEITSVKNNKKETETIKTKEVKNAASVQNENSNAALLVLDSTKEVVLTNTNLKKDTIITKDSIVKAKVDSEKPITKEATEIFKKITIFSIDAGATYAFGWTNNTTKEADGFNAVFGISVSHQFKKKWSILVGAQYNSLAHLNYSNYTSSNLQYDLGYNQTKTVITPTILYYLAVPIKLQYHLNKKNNISIGVNALYLLNTSSKVETYTESTFGTPVYNSSTKKGYMDGFSTWDLQPSFAYRRRIVKCLSVNAEVYYGLMDLKKNGVLGPIKSEHNSGLKLTLSYNFLHK